MPHRWIMIAMLCLAASAAAADDAKPPVAPDTKPLSHDPRLGPDFKRHDDDGVR